MFRRRGTQHAPERQARADIPRALRAHFASHNRQVILLAAAASVAALAFWTILYLGIEAVVMIASTASRGTDFTETPALRAAYIAGAAFVCALVFIAQRFSKRRLPPDHTSLGRTFSDIVLMLPRMTVFIWNGLRAWQTLKPREMRLAWRVLQRIEQERRVDLATLPLEIPNDGEREKIVVALQLVELVEIHPGDEGFYMRFTNDKARAMCQQLVRIPMGDDVRRVE